jgi:hypothetical protein
MFRISTKKAAVFLVASLCMVSNLLAQTTGSAAQAAQSPTTLKPQMAQQPNLGLCAIIDCNKPPKPVTTGIDPSSAITPGGQMVVIGTNFNSNDHKSGDIVLTLGSKAPMTRQMLGHHSFSQPYREAHLTVLGWSDGHAYGQIPSDISGVVDGPAFIQVRRSDGMASDTFQVQFIAARELHQVLPATDMNTDTCAKNGDENQCNGWADYSNPFSTGGQSVVGMHDKFLKNTGPPESSVDYYSFRLNNGWAWDPPKDTYNFAYLGCNTDTLGIEVFDYSSTGGKLKFSWQVNCSLLYTFQVFVNGPKGVSWK